MHRSVQTVNQEVFVKAENGKSTRVSTGQAFATAARHLIQSAGHGAQADLARRMGIAKGYLNDLLQGRKQWSLEHMDRLAEMYDLTVPDVVMMGADALRSGHWFPHVREVKGLTAHSVERGWAIFRLAAIDMRVANIGQVFTPEQFQCDPLFQSYLRAAITDAELFEAWVSRWRVLLEHYLTKVSS